MSVTSPKRVSIREVAGQSGCSIATVSNVLNGKGRVGDEQKAAVLEAVERLKYVPDTVGRSLRLGRTESIGLLFYPSCAKLFRNGFYAEVTEGLEEELTKKNYHLLLVGFEVSKNYARSSAQLLQGRVDAIVLMGGFPYRIIQELSHHPKHLVLIDTDADDLALDSVVSDGINSSRTVVDHLVGLGHTRLLMTAYGQEDYNTDTRVRGFQQALQHHRLSHEVLREHLENRAVCDAVLQRMAQPEAPTAIFAVNDNLAEALKQALEEAGYRIPRDVSLVGFDDEPPSANLKPSLTTVAVDRKLLGRTGAELIFRRIAKPDAPTTKLRLTTRLVVRNSTGPCPESVGKPRKAKH